MLLSEHTEHRWLSARNRVAEAIDALTAAVKDSGVDMSDELGFLDNVLVNVTARHEQAQRDTDEERDRAEFQRYGTRSAA